MKKDLLPSKRELLLLAGIVVLCATLASLSPKMELGLAVLSVPVSIAAGVMGLRRNWKLVEIRRQAAPQAKHPTDFQN